MAELLSPDICVIGGGRAGIAVALGAARQGVPVVLVDRDRAGRANPASDSVSSKALIAAAAYHELLRRGPAFGVTGAPLQVNFSNVSDHIRSVGEAVAPYVSAERLTALGVRVIGAPARFLDRRTVIAGEFTIIARRFVIATGAVPAVPDIPGLADIEYMTPRNAFDMTRKPGHLMVIGAGPHALELAQAFNRLGVDTTAIDVNPALPDDDPELAAVVLDRLRAEGVRIRDRVTISGITRRRGGLRVTAVENGEEVAVDGSHLLVAAGRSPNTDDLALAAAGIEFDDAGVVVDKQLRTTNRRVYAVGDVVAGAASAARADFQAECVLGGILYRRPKRGSAAGVPQVTFTDPAIARTGLSEAEARTRNASVRVLRYPFVENDLSQAERSPEGFIKVIVSPRGRVLGAAIVGHDAGELIALWSLAIANGMNIRAIAGMAPGYPSRAEISKRVGEAFDEVDLTRQFRRRIIEFLRKFG